MKYIRMKELIMKRLKYLITAICLTALLLLCCTSCFGKKTATGSSDITVSEPVFGFISEDEYNADPSADVSKKRTSLDVDTAYFLFISFDITAARNNDGQSLIDINITFDSLNIMEGTIEDVNTGIIENMIFTDATTGNVGKTTTASFKIPSSSSEPKKIEMVVKLRPVNVGESHIIISYNYDSPDNCKILGSDGYTKNLKINQVKIETPQLTLTNMGLLTWKNVKNAEYYMIYENGKAVCDIYGKEIVIDATDYSVGADIYYNIGEHVSGYHYFTIRAYSTNRNILTSDYSSAVDHIW